MRKELLFGVALGTMALSCGTAMADTPLTLGVGANPSGPEFLITFLANGAITTTLNPVYTTDPGPYDGIEDTYFGVINDTTHAISGFNLSSATQDIGGFDGDGIVSLSGGAIPGNSMDTSGYGGPDAFYTNNTGFSLTVNFIGGISANGGTDIFSLEEAVSLSAPPVITPIPEPSTWAMMALGFAGLAFAGYRNARKTPWIAA